MAHRHEAAAEGGGGVTYTVPDTISRDTDWRDQAACRDADSELFFPTGDTGPSLLIIEQAKTVCRRCPVAEACLQFAVDENIPAGIYGGLTDTERTSLGRSVRRGRTTPSQARKKAASARQPSRKRTHATVFEDNTVPVLGGHLAWTGRDQIYVGGSKYTPRQLAFTLDRGHEPDGRILTDCGSPDCILPAHLTDFAERAYCGSRIGYRRHLANGETACGPCRQANADAEANRTKQPAA
jgi:hypothetical protein